MITNIGYWEKILQDPTPAYNNLFVEQEKYLVEHIFKGAKILDVGCGNGKNIKILYKVTKNIIGIDNDLDAVKDFQNKILDFPGVEIKFGDARKLKFSENFFDFVILFDVLCNLEENKTRSLHEAARVLKKDGKIIISAYSEDAFEIRMEAYKKIAAPIKMIDGARVIFDKSIGSNISEQFSQEDLERMAKEAGLKIIDCKKINKLAYICELEKIK